MGTAFSSILKGGLRESYLLAEEFQGELKGERSCEMAHRK